MKKSAITKILAMLMTIAMILACLPISIFAEELAEDVDDILPIDPSLEIESEVTESEETENDSYLPEELQDVDSRHIIRYDSSDITLDGGSYNNCTGSIVADEAAYTGSAFYREGQKLNSNFAVECYDPEATVEDALVRMGAREITDIAINDGYCFYKTTFQVPENYYFSSIAWIPKTYLFVRFGNRILCCDSLGEDLHNRIEKNVSFYISMKVVGSSTDAQIFIDQMILVDSCKNYASEDGTACTLCGASLGITVPEGLQYRISNNEVTITGYTGTAATVEIPSTIEGCLVTAIGNTAFPNCTTLTNVTIPDGVTSIGISAFSGCTGLTAVNIPDSVSIIGSNAFRNCDSLTEITIPDNVMSIGEAAFRTCDGLTNVTIGTGVTEIPDYAFYSCDSLPVITIPANVTSVGSNAFSSSDRLAEIIFEGDAPAFNGDVFIDTTTTVYYPAGNSTWSDAVMQNYGGNVTWVSYGEETEVTEPEKEESDQDVTEPGVNIDDLPQYTYTFYTGDLTTAGNEVYYELHYRIYNSEIVIVGYYDFASFYTRFDVDIPAQIDGYPVTWIYTGAFADESILSISIPESVRKIDSSAFSECIDLCYVYYAGSQSQWNNIDIGSSNYYLLNAIFTFAVPDPDPESFVWESFSCELQNGSVEIVAYTGTATELTIPSTINGYPVVGIGKYAFQNCTGLKSVIIPNSVTSIGYAAFSGCSSLETMSLPYVVCEETTEEVKAKPNYEYGSYIEITTSYYLLGYIFGESSFTGGTSITQTYHWIRSGWYTDIAHKTATYYIPTSLKAITITGGKIWQNGFQNFNTLTSVTVGGSVTGIGYEAFAGCDNLTEVTFEADAPLLSYDIDFNSLPYPCDCYYNDDADLFGDHTVTAYYPAENSTWTEDVMQSYGGNITWKISCVEHNYVDGICSNCQESCSHINTFSTEETAATCTSDGREAGMYCLNCEQYIEGGDIIPAAGHSFSDWVETTAPTCDKYGVSTSTCFDCGETKTESIPTTEHSFDGWIVSKQPTFTAAGERYFICPNCGNTLTESIDMLVGKVAHWNIALADELKVNFYLQVTDSINSTAKARLMMGDEIITYNVSALEKTDDGYCLLTATVSAAQMNDTIVVMVMNGNTVGSTATYSVRQYCDTILADDAHSRYHTLVKEMLNYGAMAQVYFGYNAQNLANDGITGAAAVQIPTIIDKLVMEGATEGISFYGASLIYRDKIAVRFYFTGDITGCTFIADGKLCTPVAKDGMYYIEIADILPQDLDQQISLIIVDDYSNVLSVSYGPMNYIVRMNEKGDENTKNLLKALYNYHLAAKAL